MKGSFNDWLTADRLLTEWLLTDCWLIAWRFELDRKLKNESSRQTLTERTDGRTDERTLWLLELLSEPKNSNVEETNGRVWGTDSSLGGSQGSDRGKQMLTTQHQRRAKISTINIFHPSMVWMISKSSLHIQQWSLELVDLYTMFTMPRFSHFRYLHWFVTFLHKVHNAAKYLGMNEK